MTCVCKGNGPFHAPTESPCYIDSAGRHRIMSRRQLRERGQRRKGIALCGAVALGFAGMISAAVAADHANGITVSESLASAGIGRAESPARPARLVGDCGGRIMAGQEESSFPAGCAWIVPAGRPLFFASYADASAAAELADSCVGIARRPDGWTLEACE